MIEIKGFLKNRSAALAGILALFCLQGQASEVLYTSTDIELTWEATGRVSSDDLARQQKRARELAEFYRRQILPSIPGALWDGRKAPFVTVLFRSDLPSDGGLFVPPVVGAQSPGKKTRQPAETPSRVTLQINSALILSGDSERTLAHEYFHAIHWILHPDEQPWLQEGLALLFETRIYAHGKFNTNHLAAGFSSPSTALTGDIRAAEVSPAHYGHLLMYFWYLYQRCGGEDLFWKLTSPEKDARGVVTIENALRTLGSKKPGCRGFSESVNEFEIARSLNVKTIEGTDPERWFLLYSALAETNFEKVLPTRSTWMNAGSWTPYFISAGPTIAEVKGYAGARVWWLTPGLNAKAIESSKRPGPKFTKLLLLKTDTK